MSRSASVSKKSEEVSERDQFWLDHHAAQAASGQTALEARAAKEMRSLSQYVMRVVVAALGR